MVCGQECKDNGNQERNCNFLCKWFCVKNENLIDQRVYKILADNPDLFSADDAEHKRSKAFLLLGVASYLDATLDMDTEEVAD